MMSRFRQSQDGRGLRLLARPFLGLLFLSAVPLLKAQNIQLHYDLGRALYPTVQRERPMMTATVEQQSLDRFGDTFYFVDMSWRDQGAVNANWKFMRNLRFWRPPFALHLRYDGGLRFRDYAPSTERTKPAFSLNDAFMLGGSYTYLSPTRRTMLQLIPLYKYIKGAEQPHNFELCGVWRFASVSGLFTATGFFSWWRQELTAPGWGSTTFKFMSQPQLWCNLNRIKGVAPDFNLSVGTELRVSKNVDAPQWIVAPTLGLKWSFGR